MFSERSDRPDPTRSPIAAGRVCFVAFAVSTVLVACAPAPDTDPESEDLDFERVEEAPTAVLGTGQSAQAKTRPSAQKAGMSGLLPGNYPEDLPLVTPSDLFDYGVEKSQRFIDLACPLAPDQAEQRLVQAWRNAGWQPDGDGWAKDARRARFEVSWQETGTRIRIYYP